MSILVGAFRATLGLDSNDYVKGMVSADASTRTFGANITTFAVNPLLGAAGALKDAAGAALRFGQQLIADAEIVQRMAQSTGLAAETIQALRQEADLAHGSMEIASTALKDFTKNVGEALSRPGGKADILTGLIGDPAAYQDMDAILRALVQRLLELDEATRARAGEEFFGGAANQVLNTIDASGTSIDGLIGKYERLGLVTRTQAIDALAALNTEIGTAQKAFQGLQVSLATEFLAGFAGQASQTGSSITEVVVTLREELAPVVRDIGRATADLVESTREFVEGLKEVDRLLGPVIENLRDFTADVVLTNASEGADVREQGRRDRSQRSPVLGPVQNSLERVNEWLIFGLG